tara:strand:+ start:875 stop:1213 length:339 start_codon:yes stop_codon:yes gene_type:complete
MNKERNMNLETKTISITSLQFESNDPEVLVKGIIKNGHLEHTTDVLISQTQLNKIINQLKKQNSHFDLNSHLLVEKMYNSELMYTASFNSSVNTQLYLHELLNIQPYIQICA